MFRLVVFSLIGLSSAAFANPVQSDPNKIIDPPRDVVASQLDEGDYSSGYLPGTPIQKSVGMVSIPGEAKNPAHTVPPETRSVILGEDHKIIDPPRSVKRETVGIRALNGGDEHRIIDPPRGPVLSTNTSGEGYESGYLPGTPIQKYVGGVTTPEEEKTIDHPVPPVKSPVVQLQVLARDLASLNPEMDLVAQSAFWTGVAFVAVQLARMGFLAYTRNPQAAAFVPPVPMVTADGSYKVPSHRVYSIEDAHELAVALASMTSEEAEEFIENEVRSELLDYMLEVSQAVQLGRAQVYQRSCPNPDMCV